ncbi:MAG: hypothetical protein ACE5JV_04155 [Nitrososphaerales archaeon]
MSQSEKLHLAARRALRKCCETELGGEKLIIIGKDLLGRIIHQAIQEHLKEPGPEVKRSNNGTPRRLSEGHPCPE